MNDTSTPTTTTLSFKIASMPIGSGFTWFKNGFLLLKAQPWSLFITAAWTILLSLLINSVPFIGLALSTVVMPALSFGMADVAQKIRLQQGVTPFDVFSGFHANHRTRLFALGAIIAIIPAAVALILQQVDTTPIAKAIELFSNTQPATNLSEATTIASENRLKLENLYFNDPAFYKAINSLYLLTFTMMGLIALFVYSPLFLVWQNTSPLRAMLYSVITILKNILPLIVLGCLMLFAFFVISILLSILTAVAPLISTWLILPAICLFTALNYAVIFASYHNIIMASLKKAVNQNPMSANT
ncbi:hypothetical protein GCM10009007_00270 [Formosimonas limnophila]|uniref:Uncharacterized protein n=1 Tax=Formosimonas limnophila TaxID=1384487 RepID=A0A8J3CKX1_9BURK|nr:BPSS1780 family membrane protein [Formosimonas limnophila]GHA63913.1 hypothetical protein GCM10009007_00270 [Formosimonas limnophila]